MANKTTDDMDQRVQNLISQMTLNEKISQMVYTAPAIERLGVAEYNWWNEALHGLGRAGVATVFPQAIGLAATWNPDLMHQIATVISDEARAKHHEAIRRGMRQIYTGLTFWSPNINIFRDPRWGRGQETYGEDPYLTAEMGVAFVKGVQGDDPDYLKLVATPKHYAVHSGPEPDRHHFDAQIDERSMREFYLFAFEACVKEARAVSIMGAYNRVNGEPACASEVLLEKILRQEWGFDGYVVSDCGAIHDIYAHHKVVETAAEAAAVAVRNGCELNCGMVYSMLYEAVEKGLISEAEIDKALGRLFEARFRLGMFDPPEMVAYAQIPVSVVNAPEHQQVAKLAALESIVLLKNEGGLLPLDKNIGSIAVIGPNADDPLVLLGNYCGTLAKEITPLAAIKAKVSEHTQVYHAPGCEIADGIAPLTIIPSANLKPLEDHHSAGLSASYFGNTEFKGQPAISRIDPEINFIWRDSSPISGQWGEKFSVIWEGFLLPEKSGVHKIAVNGYSQYNLFLEDELIFTNDVIHHPMLMGDNVELEAGKPYAIRIELVNDGLDPQAQLLWSPPGLELESAALAAARQADVVLLMMGLSPRLEGEEMDVHVNGFEGGDRTHIGLPASQLDLLKKIHALGKPVILVLLNGSPLAVNWAAENVPAILESWYPGEAGGEAIADVLFGDYNPSGKLPLTFYRSVDDLPPFGDYQLAGHTYRYFGGNPLFSFGYGLSYTQFELENLRFDQGEIEIGNGFQVSVDIRNIGEQAGDEVVQLYTRYLDAPVETPIKELKGFKRVHLAPGEIKTLTFTLHSYQFGLYNDQMQYQVSPGKIDVMVGNAASNLPLSGQIRLVGEQTAAGDKKVFFSTVVVG